MHLKVIFITILLITSKVSFCQNIFDLGVRQIEIFFSQSNWDDSLHYYYSSGQRLIADSIIIDGEVDELVGVRYKGGDSYSSNSIKNPLNISLDYVNNGQSIDGYNTLKLSNGFHDPTFVREMLSYEIARDYMPAPKSTYANVFINGNQIGLYVCVQSIDDDFTNENFYERKGPFFKADETNFQAPGCPSTQAGIWEFFTDTLCYQALYEMQSSNDWSKLSDFMDTVNNHFANVEEVLDIDRTLWMMAFQNLFVCLDSPINSIPKNFYLFKDNNGRFSPILWNMNQSFGIFTNGLPSPVNNQDLQQLDIFHSSSNNLNIMTSKIFSSDRYRKMYVAHMRTIVNEHLANNNYYNRALVFQQLIDNIISADPNLFHSYSDYQNNLTNSVSNVIGVSELINSRVNFIQSTTEFSASPPTISSVASNISTALPHTTINITANITNTNYAYLAYRFKFSEKFTKIQMMDDGNNGDGAAGDGVFGITLDVDARDVQYYIYAENNDAGIFSPERAEKEFHQLPVVSGLVINEIMASNFTKVADQDGEYDDWVELYNGGSNAVNLSGFYLSDNENILNKWSFPNVTIQPNDYLIIWCDTAGTTQAGLHTTYRLSADQEEVYLSDPSGNIIDAVHFVNMPTDMSYARVPNGIGVFTYQEETFNSQNQSTTLLTEGVSDNKLILFPNPASSTVELIGLNDELRVYDIMGKHLYTTKNTKIDISNWEVGVYLFKSKNSVVKLIKK